MFFPMKIYFPTLISSSPNSHFFLHTYFPQSHVFSHTVVFFCRIACFFSCSHVFPFYVLIAMFFFQISHIMILNSNFFPHPEMLFRMPFFPTLKFSFHNYMFFLHTQIFSSILTLFFMCLFPCSHVFPMLIYNLAIVLIRKSLFKG